MAKVTTTFSGIGPGGGIQATIEGIDQLDKNFKSLGVKIQRKILREAARAGGNIFLKSAKAIAPVNSEQERVSKQSPGTLKRNIKLRVSPFQKRGGVSLDVRTGTREEMSIPADSKYYYPAHVEYGHASPGRGGSGEKTTPPHPFMRPAYDGAKNYAKSVSERVMREGVEREAEAIAKAVTT